MATVVFESSTPLGSPSSLIVYYKYVKEMPVYQKSAKSFLTSIVEKYKEYVSLKLELHVSPFYGLRSSFVWQPVIDFDTPESISVAKQFCKEELSSYSKYFVEVTGTSVHIVSRIAYGPIKEDEITVLREYLHERFRSYEHLDITSSIRHLPIRRVPSVDSTGRFVMRPVMVTQFLGSSYEELIKQQVHSLPTRMQFGHILANYTLPRMLLPWTEAPWGASKVVSGKTRV